MRRVRMGGEGRGGEIKDVSALNMLQFGNSKKQEVSDMHEIKLPYQRL